MAENQENPKNLIDTTDYLETIGVFKCWKNFFFVILIICYLLMQISFWAVDRGVVKVKSQAKEQAAVQSAQPTAAEQQPQTTERVILNADEVAKAAKEAAADQNKPAQPEPAITAKAEEKKPAFALPFEIKEVQLAWLVRFVNFVAIPTAALYCLTILFCLKVSFIGRLGGMKHISKAFFLSLFFLVLLLPWQKFFGMTFTGVIYTPAELFGDFSSKSDNVILLSVYYARFAAYWFVTLVLLIYTQIRTMRWAKATLRRLEVV